MAPQQLVLSPACFSGTELGIKLSLGLRAGAREDRASWGQMSLRQSGPGLGTLLSTLWSRVPSPCQGTNQNYNSQPQVEAGWGAEASGLSVQTSGNQQPTLTRV